MTVRSSAALLRLFVELTARTVGGAVVRLFEPALSPAAPPVVGLSHEHVDGIEAQIDSATAFKVAAHTKEKDHGKVQE